MLVDVGNNWSIARFIFRFNPPTFIFYLSQSSRRFGNNLSKLNCPSFRPDKMQTGKISLYPEDLPKLTETGAFAIFRHNWCIRHFYDESRNILLQVDFLRGFIFWCNWNVLLNSSIWHVVLFSIEHFFLKAWKHFL